MRHLIIKTLWLAVLCLHGGATGWAKEQIAVVIGAKSTVKSMSKSQVRDIFLGDKELLPNGERAVPADQPRSTSITTDFYAAVADMTVKEISVHWAKKIFAGRGTPPQQVEGGDDKVKEWIKSKANGIGYIKASSVDPTVKVLLTVEL